MPRLFIAIDLPATQQAEVKALCQGLPAAHWSQPGQLHLTLRFLGDTPEEEVAQLRGRLCGVARPAFPLTLRGVGVFPRKPPARVLWAGVAPEEPARALKAAIDELLEPDPEAAERGFSPHLTLARFRDDPEPALARFLADHAGFAGTPWTVSAFHLYRSTLGREAAVHEVLESYALDGR